MRNLLLRLRFIPVLLSLILLIYFIQLVKGTALSEAYVWRIRYDYMFWTVTLLTCFSVYLDVRLFWGRYSYASTYLISLIAGLNILIGRVITLLINVFHTAPHSLNPPFGPPYADVSAIMSIATMIISIPLALVMLFLHCLLGKPIVFFEAMTLEEWFRGFMDQGRLFWRGLWENKWFYLAAAFLFAFTFRLVPEILWWPWHIGWDTVEYTAHLMDFQEKLNPFMSYYWMGGMRNIPPLLNIILLPLAYGTGPWYAFKVYPPIAFGLLALSSALLARGVLRLGRFESFLVSLTMALYILNLRISWDYQRQLLGSIFMLLTLAALESWKSLDLKKAVASGALILACALSHEVTAFFALAASSMLTYVAIRGRDPRKLAVGVAGAIASIVLEAWYWRSPYTPSSVLGVAPIGVVSTSYSSSAPEAVGYLTAGYGLTLPLALIALSREGKRLNYTLAGMMALFLAGLSPLLAPQTSAATWYRFMIGAAPIASTLAGAGLLMAVKDKRYFATYLLILSLTGVGFTYSAELTNRFTVSLREFPGALHPSPAVYVTLDDLKKLSEWFRENNVNSTIVCEASVCRWIHLGIRNPTPDILVWLWKPLSSPQTLNQTFSSKDIEEVYVVTVDDLTELKINDVCLETLREGLYKVYLVKRCGR